MVVKARGASRLAPKSEQAAVRASAGARHDLWFAKGGLYRVEVLGLAARALSSLPLIAVLLVIATVPRPSSYSFAAVYGMALLSSTAAAYLFPSYVANRRRRRSSMSLARAKADEKAKKIPWEDVRSMVVTKRTAVRLQVGRGLFTRTLRASISRNDYNQLKDIAMQSNARGTLEFRDGIFS